MTFGLFKIATMAGLSTLSEAFLCEEKRPEFEQTSITLEGTHAEHTTDENGNFKHPFLQVGPEVGSIYYKGGKTISTKLHRVRGPHKWHDEHVKQRAFNQKTEKVNSHGLMGYFETLKNWLMPSQSVYFTDNMENRWNLLYLGGIYMGTPNDGGSQQSFSVVWDTGSGAYLARSTLCTSCSGDKFDMSRSSTFAYKSPASYDTVTYMDGT